MDATARRAVTEELYSLPGHLLWRASARISAEVANTLPHGVDIHAYAALLGLADEEPQSQQGLARMVDVSGTTMTTVAETLLRDDLVERVRNPADRRSYALTRTPAGRAAVRRWRPHVRRLESQLTVSFTTEDVARLQELLVAVVADELDVRTPDELMSSTGFLVTRAQQLTHREFLIALRPLDIEPRHYGTMRVLRRCDGITQGQVSQLLEVSPATVVQMVDDLERRGLVVRERDPADRRVQRLRLTPAARSVLTRAGTPIRRMDVHFGEPGSPERVDLVRLLRLLLTNGRT